MKETKKRTLVGHTKNIEICWQFYETANSITGKSLKKRLKKINEYYYCFIWCTNEEWENICEYFYNYID